MAATPAPLPIGPIALAALVVVLIVAAYLVWSRRSRQGRPEATLGGTAGEPSRGGSIVRASEPGGSDASPGATGAPGSRSESDPGSFSGRAPLDPGGFAGLPPHIRPGGQPGQQPPPGGASGQEQGPARVSFGVGMTGISREEGALHVLWHGINDGTVPVAVQWGQPEVRVEGEGIEVRYVYDPQPEGRAAFHPPRTRPVGPDEIVSRTAHVPLAAIGRDPTGLTVRVFVAYGSAMELSAAQTGEDAYLSWQEITYTRPRTIPPVA